MDITVSTIRDEADHLRALARLKDVWSRTDEAALAEADILGTLIDAFERRRWPNPRLDPVALIQTMIDDGERSRAELVALIGANRVTEVLARKRALNLDMIRKISAAWSIPIELLTPTYELDANARKSSINAIFNIDK